MRTVKLVVFAAAGLLLAADARGAIVITGGPASSPIGGGGFSSGSGNIGLAGGLTWNYAGLDLSQSEHLYWGLSSQNLYGTLPTGFSLDSNSVIAGTELFGSTTSGVSANTLVLSGSTALRDYHNGILTGHSNVATRLLITVTGTGNWVAAPSSLIDPTFAYPTYLWEITGGSGFSANLLVSYLDPHTGSWQPYLTGWNSLHTYSGDHPVVSVTPGWYWEAKDSVIPEPTTFAIWAMLGGLGIVIQCRRLKRAK